MVVKIPGPGEWGTENHPLIMAERSYDGMHSLLMLNMRHVHTPGGRCLKNRYGRRCSMPANDYDWQIECSVSSCHAPAIACDKGVWACGVHQCL